MLLEPSIQGGPGHPEVTGYLGRRLARFDQAAGAADLGVRELLAATSKIPTGGTAPTFPDSRG